MVRTRTASLLCTALFSLFSLQMQAQATPPAAAPIPAPEHKVGPADVVQLALDKHLYFAAELALQNAPGLAPEQTQYFEGMLAFHEGRFEDARKDLIAALNAKPTVLTGTQKIEAFEALAENARLTNLYGACAQMYQDIDTIWGAKLGDAEKGILQSRHFCAAQMHTPAQTIQIDGAFTIQRRQDGEYPIRIGDRDGLAALDIGAAESVITESTAKAWGVIPSDATVTLHGYSGGAFPGHPAVIPELTIGNATLHNVAVLVTPDANFNVGPNVKIPALLGFPVAYALGRMTFTRDGSLTVSPASQTMSPSSPTGAADSGAKLWIGDYATVLVELQTAPVTGNSFRMTGGLEPRLFLLDTGSRDSYFTDHYYNEHREAFPGAPPETAKLAGAGGMVSIPSYGSDHIPLRCDPWVFLVTGPHVLTQPIDSVFESYEGLLGQDVLGGFKSYTIDLRTMRFAMVL